jgi:hypothetical protein
MVNTDVSIIVSQYAPRSQNHVATFGVRPVLDICALCLGKMDIRILPNYGLSRGGSFHFSF